MADEIGLNMGLLTLELIATNFSTPYIRLFTNNITVSPGDTVDTYVEPDASWYTPGGQAIVYGDAYVNSSGVPQIVTPEYQFNYSGASSPVLIYGWFVTSPSTVLMSSGNFDTPVPMGTAGNACLAGSQIAQPAQTQGPWTE